MKIPHPLPTIAALNAASREDFIAQLQDTFEHAPWVAADVADLRPFADADALHRAMIAAVATRSEDERVTLSRGTRNSPARRRAPDS